MKIERLVVGQIKTNCYVLTDGAETAVIDPGGNVSEIIKVVKKQGNELKYIICTHAHYDHTDGIEDLKAALGGKIVTHEAEKDFAEFIVDKFIKESDIIQIGETKLKAISTPGHTPGCFCLLGKNLIFTGDTLFKDGIGRTDLPGGDMQAMEESLSKLRGIIKPGMMVYPGHGEFYEAS